MRLLETGCAVTLAAALLAGGATQKGIASDSIVQLACLPLLAALVLNARALRQHRPAAFALTALIVAIALLQLAPLPPWIWTHLPGRQVVLDVYQTATLTPPWLPVSVSPWATQRVAFALLPPLTLFMGALLLSKTARRRLWLLTLGVALLSCAVDLIQAVDGPDSPLRFHSFTSRTHSVGFFANANHEAALLYASIPIAAYLLSRVISRWRIAAALGVNLTLLIGLATTGSRSALLLGGVAFALSYAAFYRAQLASLAHRPSAALLLGAALTGALIAGGFGLQSIIGRLGGDDVLADNRWLLNQQSARAAVALFPFGSGLGTFERVFPLFQTPQTLMAGIINHAHDDLLELVIETGAPGALAIVFMLALFFLQLRRALREAEGDRAGERIAALIVIGLLIMHSCWDYPLRTSALASLFALCCAAAAAPERAIARKAAAVSAQG